MRMKILATVAVLTAFAALGAVGTLAVFTDTLPNANVFETGTIDLTQSRPPGFITFEDMYPGDVITKDLVLTNASGTRGDLRYAISAEADNTDTKNLRDVLFLKISEADDVPADGDAADPCDQFDGDALYSGFVGTGDQRVGNTTEGPDSGDRELTAGASETLCFRVELDDDIDNLYRLATTTVTFTFSAEQTRNNS